MAVTGTTSSTPYVGDGVTVAFPTVFRFLEKEDLVVTVTPSGGGTPVVQALGVHYNVTGEGDDAGGTVTFLAAPAAGAGVTIERDTPIVQDVHLALQGDFFPETHEEMFDQGTMIDQELDRRVTTLENSGTTNNAVAGNGIGVAGSTWNVGAGKGIQANADDIEVIYGAAGELVAVDATAAGAGARDKAARIDHKHALSVGSPVALTVGNAGADGVSNAAARADHVHPLAAPGAPADISATAASAGVSSKAAREDHKHSFTTGVPANIGAVASAGVSNNLPRLDHVHGHGAQAADSTMHAAAVAGGTSGFMSGADKTKLDALGTAAFTGAVNTGDAVATVVAARDIAEGKLDFIEVMVTGRKTASGQGAGYLLAGTFRRDGGVVTQIGATTVLATHEDDAAMNAAFVIVGLQVTVKVTGIAATSIDWRAFGRVCESP